MAPRHADTEGKPEKETLAKGVSAFLRTTRGRLLFLSLLGLLLILSAVAAMRCGVFPITFQEILSSLTGSGDPIVSQIVYRLRLPRVLLGLLTGSALAVSGGTLQGVMRNPLASPGLLGVSAGAGLAGTFILIFLPGWEVLLLPASFAGALLAAGLVCLLAMDRNMDPLRLILSGAAVSALLAAVTTMLMLARPDRAGNVLDFMSGSLAMKDLRHIRQIAPYLPFGFLTAFFAAERLNILALGDDTAASLGISVRGTRLLATAASALLAASAVSAAGLLGFVGLAAPHVVRMCIGPDNRFLLPGAALTGAVMVVLCDAAGRVFLAPSEIPAGVILAVLGAPFFLWLLRRTAHDY